MDAAVGFTLTCLKAQNSQSEGLGRTLRALGLPHSIPDPRRARRHEMVRRARRPAAIALVGAIGMAGGWMHWIDIDPGIQVQTPTLSGSNAFTSFERAYALIPNTLEMDFAQAGIGNPQMVAQPGKQWIAWPQSGPSGEPRFVGADKHVYTLAEKEAVVRANRPALEAVREGLALPYLAPPLRKGSDVMPWFSNHRALARLLNLEAQTEAARGDWRASAASSLDAVELGVRIQSQSVLIGKLVGIACEDIGRSGLWLAVEHLSAAEARRAARRLVEISGQEPDLAFTLRVDQQSELAVILDMMQKPGFRRDMSAFSSGSNATNWLIYLRSLKYSKRQMVDNYLQFTDKQIAQVSQPWTGPQPDMSEADLPSDPLNRFMDPTYSGLRLTDCSDRAQNTLLETALALRAYRLEHGRYPDGIGEIVPRYLPQVPADPFGAGRPMKYRRTTSSYLLYSVGPDAIDDGGQPIEKVARGEKTHPSRPDADSKGDIVAGINVPTLPKPPEGQSERAKASAAPPGE